MKMTDRSSARREEVYYCNLDFTRRNSNIYDEINVNTNKRVVSRHTRNDRQSRNERKRKQTNDIKAKDELFSVKRRTVLIWVALLVFVVVAQIATCCFVGIYIANSPTDSPTVRTSGGSGESKMDQQSNTSHTNGRWSTWQTWSSCSSSCGNGFKTRSRDCTNPAPSAYGKQCSGQAIDIASCNSKPCLDGRWSTWQTWSSCSSSCGNGFKTRSRKCTNPAPSAYGKQCSGQAIDIASCNSKPCLDGRWSTWQTWSSCSSSCGNGFKTRSRKCTNPAPSAYGKQCSGQAIDIASCNSKPCLDISSSFTVTEPNSIVNNYLTFSKEIFNKGSDFSLTSGVFTCRQPGVYVFSFVLVKKRASTRVDRVFCRLYKNGDVIILGQVDPTDDDTDKGSAYAGNTAVLHLERGDKIGLRYCTNPSPYMEPWTSFTGFLLNPDL